MFIIFGIVYGDCGEWGEAGDYGEYKLGYFWDNTSMSSRLPKSMFFEKVVKICWRC
jgi:hypothetical protein